MSLILQPHLWLGLGHGSRPAWGNVKLVRFKHGLEHSKLFEKHCFWFCFILLTNSGGWQILLSFAVVLPSPPWSLRHSPSDESAPLTQFQEELIQLASQLNGDHQHPKYPNLGKLMNVGQGHGYVKNAMVKFLETGRAALKAGADPETVNEVKPTLIGRKAGRSKLYDSSWIIFKDDHGVESTPPDSILKIIKLHWFHSSLQLTDLIGDDWETVMTFSPVTLCEYFSIYRRDVLALLSFAILKKLVSCEGW